MAPFKWSLIVLLGGILLLGLPIRGESEVPSEETKPSSVKECRVHIEKALEQYWEQKEPGEESSSTEGIQQNTNTPNEEDHEDEETLESKNNPGHSENNVENDDDDEEEDDQENTEHNTENRLEDDDDDEDEGEDDDENDDEEDETHNEISKERESNSDNSVDESLSEEDDDDEEDEEDEEEDTEKGEIAGKDENEEAEDEVEETEGDDDENDEEADEKDSDDVSEDDLPETEEEDEALEKESEVNQAREEDVTKDDTEEDEQEETDEEESDEGREDDEEDEEEEEEDEDVGEHTSSDSTTDEVSNGKIPADDETETESEKITGEADSASTGVASELPEEQPSIKQPEASQVAEETLDVTVPEQEEETSTEEKDEEQQIESELEPSDETGEKDDDTIENIYEEEEEDDDSSSTLTFRNRDHIDVILGLDEIGTEYDKEEEKLAQSIFREIKKIEATSIKPIEMLYKYADSTTRVLGDAEIFNKPMLLFLGPWSAGKTTIINYLLGLERTPAALKTGTGITDVDFTLVTYGDQRQVVSGTELAADWRYAGVQKFGQGFLDHFRSIQIPHTLLRKVTIVDTPGILENRKNTERGYPFNDAFQWFIDRADAIYVVLDPTKVDIGGELGSVLDQLKGRDVRFILNKADTIRRSDLMRVVGQLFWNLSPLMSSTEAPVIYAVSLTTKPYHPSAPARFLADQEKNFLYDMKDTLEKRVENRILYARRHAVRVRNHAKMVDCYLATYYRHKSIFSSKKNVAKLITENPRDYNIFDGLGGMTNISRYDLPDPAAYKQFFKLHPLYDFKPIASTCSYFRGCPMDKLDGAISKEIPELFAKYKKEKKNSSDALKQEGR